MEPDCGAIGAGDEKVPYVDSGVFGVGASKLSRSVATFMVISSRYRRTNNADDA